MVTTPVHVYTVKIVLLPTFPVRVYLVVYGQRVQGVDLEITQEHKGKEVLITITQTHTRQLQPTMRPLEERVFLEGDFTPETYSLRVNNYATTFEVR
jgi:hypothetical protein